MKTRNFLAVAGAAAAVLLSSNVGAVAQTLTVPPAVDLFQHFERDDKPSYEFPRIRIWGWSQNGRVAYSEENIVEEESYDEDEGYPTTETKLCVNFAVFNMVSDRTTSVFRNCATLPDNDNMERAVGALYNARQRAVRQAFAQNNIVEQQADYLPFPIERNGAVYNVKTEITSTVCIHEDSEESSRCADPFPTDVVKNYRVIIDRNDALSKTIKTVEGAYCLMDLHVGGYFLSPYENRALIVIFERLWEWRCNNWNFKLTGAHLETGFR